MKAILEFDLNDNDDEMAHRRCIESTKMAVALFDILNNAWRNVETVEDYQENINAYCEGINLDDLIR
jgi:hypothetical protein